MTHENADDSEDSGSEHDIWTDFETEEGPCGSLSEDGDIVWGAYCPQPDCGELNTFQGDPSRFAKRPFRCIECDWVSLINESVTEIESDLYTTGTEQGGA